MRYARSINVVCEECGEHFELEDMPVQGALEEMLTRRWVGLTSSEGTSPATRVISLDEIRNDVRVIRSVEDLGDIAAKRVALVCADCAPSALARLSDGGQRPPAGQEIVDAIARIEGELVALRKAVLS